MRTVKIQQKNGEERIQQIFDGDRIFGRVLREVGEISKMFDEKMDISITISPPVFCDEKSFA